MDLASGERNVGVNDTTMIRRREKENRMRKSVPGETMRYFD